MVFLKKMSLYYWKKDNFTVHLKLFSEESWPTGPCFQDQNKEDIYHGSEMSATEVKKLVTPGPKPSGPKLHIM